MLWKGAKTMNDQPPTFYNSPPQQQSSPSPGYPPLYESVPWQQPGMPHPMQQPPYFPSQAPTLYPRAMTRPLRPSRLAPAGLILGIVGLLISLGVFSRVTPLFIFSLAFGFILSTAGMVFSALSLSSISRKALAIIGLILSIITFLLLLLVTLLGILVSALPH